MSVLSHLYFAPILGKIRARVPDLLDGEEVHSVELAKQVGLHPLSTARALRAQTAFNEPIRWAEELGIELLLETHGPVTDSVDGMGELLDALDHEQTVGICLDTGNSWLGGSEPLDFVKRFASQNQARALEGHGC